MGHGGLHGKFSQVDFVVVRGRFWQLNLACTVDNFTNSMQNALSNAIYLMYTLKITQSKGYGIGHKSNENLLIRCGKCHNFNR